MVLSLQEIEFLFDPIDRVFYVELEGATPARAARAPWHL